MVSLRVIRREVPPPPKRFILELTERELAVVKAALLNMTIEGVAGSVAVRVLAAFRGEIQGASGLLVGYGEGRPWAPYESDNIKQWSDE